MEYACSATWSALCYVSEFGEFCFGFVPSLALVLAVKKKQADVDMSRLTYFRLPLA